MTAPRRATLTKAPAASDVVTDLLSAPTTSGRRATLATVPPAPDGAIAPVAQIHAPRPTRATRAGTRPRMEPFSSRIDIDLRDQLDQHIAKSGESIVDLLDRALRAALQGGPR